MATRLEQLRAEQERRRRRQLRDERLRVLREEQARRSGTQLAPAQPAPIQQAAPQPAAPAGTPMQQALQEVSQLPQPGQVDPSAMADILGPTLGEIPGVITGARVGRALGPAGMVVGGLAGGAIGAAGGLAISRAARGEKVTMGEVAMEGGLSVLPAAGTQVAGRAARRLLRRQPLAAAQTKDLGARLLQDEIIPQHQPAVKEQVSQMFEMVSQSGARLEPTQFNKPLKNMSGKQFKEVQRVLNTMPAPRGRETEGFGEGVAEVFKRIRDGKEVGGIDIGTLQHVSSRLKAAVRLKKQSATIDALNSFTDIIDDVISNGRFLEGAEQSGLLIEARRQWRQLKRFEDVQAWVASNTQFQEGGKLFNLRLNKMADTLRAPQTRLEVNAANALDSLGMRQDIETFLKNMQKVHVRRDQQLPRGIATMLTEVFASPVARARFNQIVRQRPVITEEVLTFLVNIARRTGQQFILPRDQENTLPAVLN